ncbi:exosome complex component rrp42 [Aspergillus lentulus]|uniref:Ribosomal RNA-processing protein 42 n=1 Tax=Aspergillus lentulus TaxID=293939 RepID=A0ABQ1AYV6_ASPLE|nr:exosome complex component rrp42 [Aspergillus lentulus]GFF50955.1 exosome complex component rrp42 [Aspergillus lentulus]GFF75418.1 exosome complex component rrp42 [Aspergillus lentulus]GFF90611.1 exosome complex component rrp42 [Aspergillus lentulus]GFF94727.1 exosome complex component rrp42 [Aspergillus lentulus]GFG15915.1 exosome complex component rrp42 [Aspergillus lentulus]
MSAQRQASSASQTPHLSPAELSYLYASLALPDSPIRPDGRSPTQFRPLTAETDILPGTNGSARVGFADGTQAIVGVKAEVEKTALAAEALNVSQLSPGDDYAADQGADGKEGMGAAGGHESWVQISIEIPGFRDDDALPVFLSEMMREPLIESVSSAQGGDMGMAGGLKGRLVINRRWHWRLYIDVLLLSQPLSYPLPLLSLTTHLALLSTRLPKLKSKGEEDPFFDDDWNAAEYLYPRQSSGTAATPSLSQFVRPPVTLLVISVADNIIFDPSREEIAVADTVLALSVCRDGETGSLKLLSMRTIDPPSRLTQPGVPNSENVATIGSSAAAEDATVLNPSTGEEEVPGVWRPRRGGVKRSTIARMVKAVLEKGGVGEDVLEGLEGVSVG